MTKINKQSTAKLQEIAKFPTWQEATEAIAFMNFPAKADWRKRLIYTMLKWAELPTSETIMDFCIDYKIDRTTLKEWADTYEDIGQAYIRFKQILGNKSYKGAKHKQFDKDVVFKNLHTYDDEFETVNRYWSDLKKTEQPDVSASTRIIVEMEPAPVTSLVKERKRDGEDTIRDQNEAGSIQAKTLPGTDLGRSGEQGV